MCQFVGWCALPHEAQAAWAQAVLSVVAILVAATFPLISERARKRERISVYLSMIGVAFHRASVDTWNISNRIGSAVNPLMDNRDWARITKMFENVQYHEMPDADLISILDDTQAAVQRFQGLWDILLARKATSFPVTSADAAIAKQARDEIQVAYEQSLRVRHKYSWAGPIDAIKYRLFLRSIRRELDKSRK